MAPLTKKQLKSLVSQNKTKRAIEELLQITQKIEDKDLHDETVIQSSKFEKYQEENRKDTTSQEELNISLSRIHNALLQIIEKLPDEHKIAKKQQYTLWQYITGAAVIVSILGGLAEFLNYIDIVPNRTKTITTVSNTVRVKVVSQYDIPLPATGTVHLTYGDAEIPKEINNNNEAIFTGVPNDYFAEGRQVKITFDDPLGKEPYYAVAKDSLYQLEPNQSIELLIALKGVDKLYGIVKDFKTSDFIEGARVSVLNLETFSNENGWWELKITDDEQKRKFHTLRVSKAGYQNWEQSNLPAQVEKEIPILLKPK